MNIKELFWQASLEEMKRGFVQEENYYVCLLCGRRIEKGLVYSEGDALYEAEKYMQLHINGEHQSVFEFLINMDKKLTGLSEHQKQLLRLFHQGLSDAQVQEELQIGSRSTIRNHRFVLKEKEKQSRVFLVLMELLKQQKERSPRNQQQTEVLPLDQDEIILKRYFPQGTNGPLKSLHMKEKSRLLVLREVARRFDAERFYSEKEVNAILQKVHDDFSTLRRYLVDYGFLGRKADGSQYWRKVQPEGMEQDMDRRKELKHQYREMKIEGGVYQIRNKVNNKILLVTTPNFKTINGSKMQLQHGDYRNKKLQEEWQQYGEEAFVFEVLEVLDEKEDSFSDSKRDLSKLEEKWLERLQPYGERGYN